MTCIAVVRGPDGVVWMGGDSCVMRGYTRSSLGEGDAKVFRLGESDVWLGTAGANATGHIRYGFHVPEIGIGQGVAEWMVLDMAPAMKARYVEAGIYGEDLDPDTQGGWQRGIRGELIVVVSGNIFHIDQNVFPMHVAGDYFAIGSGADVALGALSALLTHAPHIHPRQMLNTALYAAGEHSDGVAPEHVILECK